MAENYTHEIHILNLGAGVQSTTLYLLSMEGRMQAFDFAIAADTGEEAGAEERRLGLRDPVDSWYAHLDWLISLNGPPILVRGKSRMGDDLTRGENSTGQRFTSIPAYTKGDGATEEGQTPRQCTREYKIEIIERTIRREILGLAPRALMPKSVLVHQYYGISWDERTRAFDIQRRFRREDGSDKPHWKCHFPLLSLNGKNLPGWTRADCTRYNEQHVPHTVYGSSCVFCPYQSDESWSRRLQPGPTRNRIVQIDTSLRTPGIVANRGLKESLFLTRDCKPITEVQFTTERQEGFVFECEGGCGL